MNNFSRIPSSELNRPPMFNEIIRIWTDGSCLGGDNPGFGGWGAILKYGDQEAAIGGASDIEYTTSNRMELLAAIKALEFVKRKLGCLPYVMIINSDSTYLVNTMKEQMGPIMNKGLDPRQVLEDDGDLFLRLWLLSSEHFVQWRWVRIHCGLEENEIAESMAKRGSRADANGGARQCGFQAFAS